MMYFNRFSNLHFSLFFLCIVSLFASVEAEAKAIKRIIALSPHSVEMLFAIGAGDRIVGTLDYADYPEAALEIPRIGNFTGIQIERVVELQPDLIVAWKSGNKQADLEKLESLGFNLFYSHPENIEAISNDLLKLGELINLTESAVRVANEVSLKHQKIKKYYSEKTKINVFYQLWHEPIRTVGAGSWVESLIEDCNGVNTFKDAESPYPVVSLENILVKNPQVIIIPHHSGNIGEKREIWENWQTIDAVKHQRVFTIDGDVLHRFSPRAVEGLGELCKAIDSAR